MLSWTQQQTLFQNLTSDNNSDNLTMGKTLINMGNKKLQAILGIHWNEETRTFATVTDAITGTSYQSYYLPENFKSLTDFYVTSGTTQYHAEIIHSPEIWGQINSTTTGSTSNFVQFVHLRNDRIELYPIPASTLTATITYRAIDKDLVNEDYTTGTITTLTNGAKAVTGSSTVFTAAMVGRYFKIDADGEWYKIGTYTSATAIALLREFQGTSVAAGTENYTIGQMPNLPPDTHDVPVFYAIWKWGLFRKDVQFGREFERMWKEGIRDAEKNWSNWGTSNIISDKSKLKKRGVINPNNYPTGMS